MLKKTFTPVSNRLGLTAILLFSLQACGLLPREESPARPPPPIIISGPSAGQGASTPKPPTTHRPETTRPETPPNNRAENRPEARQEPGRSEPSRPGGTSRGPIAPIPDQKIDLAGSCTQTEEDGYREQATLTVRNNQVQSMSWQLWIGKKGTCKFDFADFAQTKTRPSIEMVERNGSGCKLVIYQDPRRVTLGFADCQKHCTGNIYGEAYPVMFDPKTGSCANLSH